MVAHVETGLDVLIRQGFMELQGKRIGIITNHTGLSKTGIHIVDAAKRADGVELKAIFSPEHGYLGTASDGEQVASGVDTAAGVTVFSLYGVNRKPSREMLEGLDALVFDVQDVGARFYTYIYTMSNCMEAAAENGLEFVVLDRPNPINGTTVEGPLLESGFESFVGEFPIPIRHGMTIGELALMIKGEGWIDNADSLHLTVVTMTGWRRDLWLDQTDVTWVPPSPNMRALKTATVYPGMCLIEGTNVSEGRGTDFPFEMIGAPWINSDTLLSFLERESLPGVEFMSANFMPVKLPGAKWPKFENQSCRGVQLSVTDRDAFKPVMTGLYVVDAIRHLYPDNFKWTGTFDRLYGSDRFKMGRPFEYKKPDLTLFNKLRRMYLRYE